MNWLDKLPYTVILPLAVFLAVAPLTPEPHLWQKLKMLFAGTLIDQDGRIHYGTPWGRVRLNVTAP